MEPAELKTRTFHSVAWALVRIGASNVVGFVVFSVLARVLSPRDFGIFALATLVVEFTRIVATAGLGDAVLRAVRVDEPFMDTAFWANILLGAAVGALAWFAAPFYAALVDQPAVVPVLRALAVLVPVAALGGIHTARKLNAFGHKALAARTTVGGLLGGAAAIAAALHGWATWSLVAQAAIVDVVGVAFAWQSFPWRPRLRFHAAHLRAIVGFSAGMMLTQLMWLLLTRMQDVVIGRFVSAAAVGTYRTAWRMIDLIAQTTIQPIVGVSFVTLARLQDEPARFRAAFNRMLGLGALFTLPAIFGFGVLADAIIPTLFGARWEAGVPVARILTLMAIPFTLNYFVGSALAALGRSGVIARVAMVQAAATIVLSLAAASFGLQWIAAAYVFRAYLTMPYQMRQFRHETGIDGIAMLRTVMPPLVGALAMVGALLLLAPPLHRALGGGVAYLAAAVPAGVAVFAGALLLFGRAYIRSNLAALRPLRGGGIAQRVAS